MDRRLTLVVLLACFSVVAARCACKQGGGGGKHGGGKEKKGVEVNFDRDINAKVCGKVKFGPCGRPKSNIDIGITDSGETNVNGNAFNALETAGRLSEILKIVGNRFKPEVSCPPRPASNVDTSAESILAQRTVRRKPGRSSGRYVCKHPGRRVKVSDSGSDGRVSSYGSDSGSGHGSGRGSGSGHGSGRGSGSGHGSGRGSGSGHGSGRGSGSGAGNVDVSSYEDESDSNESANVSKSGGSKHKGSCGGRQVGGGSHYPGSSAIKHIKKWPCQNKKLH